MLETVAKIRFQAGLGSQIASGKQSQVRNVLEYSEDGQRVREQFSTPYVRLKHQVLRQNPSQKDNSWLLLRCLRII